MNGEDMNKIGGSDQTQSETYGVDFDGTLVTQDDSGQYDPAKIGEPVPRMVRRVKRWLSEGKMIVILTARVNPASGNDAKIARAAIQEWCLDVFGIALEVTCEKNKRMSRIYDDLAVTVEKNTGRIITEGFEDEDGDVPDSLGSLA